MEYSILGDPSGGPTLRLDHRTFSYAGKFVMSNTGKAIACEDDQLTAAVAFNRDRTDDSVIWLRYITVHVDRRGEGIGSRLAAFLIDQIGSDATRFRIAVNNPYAYEAMYKAGFGYTGDRTGIAEVILEHPRPPGSSRYREGLDIFTGRADLSEAEESFLDRKRATDPPPSIEPPPPDDS